MAVGYVPAEHGGEMRERDDAGQHAEMAAVVEQRQKDARQSRERADAEHERQHQEGAGAGCADPEAAEIGGVVRRLLAPVERDGCGDVENDAREQHEIVDDLLAVPADGLKTGAHCFCSCGAGSGGGRVTSAVTNSPATTIASAGQM